MKPCPGRNPGLPPAPPPPSSIFPVIGAPTMPHSIAEPVVHREHWRDADDDQLRLECGVCGVWGAEDNAASAIVALGLHALQHRGQEACGIASVHEARFHTERHMGLV